MRLKYQILLTLLLIPELIPAQGVDYLKNNYSKREVYITMRDGLKLFTAIYTPRDTSIKYPIIMVKTPY